MKVRIYLPLLMLLLLVQNAFSVFERGEYPWNVNLKSFYDTSMEGNYGSESDGYKDKMIPWLLNLGPTGIRGRIYPDKANHIVVKYVFQDGKSPTKGLIEIEDIIVGANGEKFKTLHRFGNAGVGSGWEGPMMELAKHIEDSQGTDGKLNLIVWPKGAESGEKVVTVQLRAVGRFADSFPYDCKRSEMMLEELCDFIVMDYKSDNWKKPDSLGGAIHVKTHQLLALMASGNSKYDNIVKECIKEYYDKRYDPAGGGFQTWSWGFDGIVMGEYYLLHKDKKLLPAIDSLTKTMPLGSRNGSGIYTHRSLMNLMGSGGKPYASIAAISGLQMIAMSLFDKADLPYVESLHQNIHQHYLNTATPESASVSYAFNSADRFNDPEDGERHAIINLKDSSKGITGNGPGAIVPNGMKDLGEYDVFWPTKADPRWKPLDWLEKEFSTNIVTELKTKGQFRVDRNNPKYKQAPEPTTPYKTSQGGSQLAPVGMGAVAHMVRADIPESWGYLGQHLANTCALSPSHAFDGHAGSNLHAFWSILGAAKSDDQTLLRSYFDYMKTFLILSEAHDGGLILQPWGRDRPNCNGDTSYGPRTLPTATGAILLALGKKHLQITGAGSAGKDSSVSSRKARSLPSERQALLNKELVVALAEISNANQLVKEPINVSKARENVWLAKVAGAQELVFQAMASDKQASFSFLDLTLNDHAELASLVAKHRPDNKEALAYAGIFYEVIGNTKLADAFYEKAGSDMKEKVDQLFQ